MALLARLPSLLVLVVLQVAAMRRLQRVVRRAQMLLEVLFRLLRATVALEVLCDSLVAVVLNSVAVFQYLAVRQVLYAFVQAPGLPVWVVLSNLLPAIAPNKVAALSLFGVVLALRHPAARCLFHLLTAAKLVPAAM